MTARSVDHDAARATMIGWCRKGLAAVSRGRWEEKEAKVSDQTAYSWFSQEWLILSACVKHTRCPSVFPVSPSSVSPSHPP